MHKDTFFGRILALRLLFYLLAVCFPLITSGRRKGLPKIFDLWPILRQQKDVAAHKVCADGILSLRARF